jgi:hypothetical protein
MRVIRVQKKKKMSKPVIAIFAFASLAVLAAGGILMNPILIGAGVAGLFLMCGAAVSLTKSPSHAIA